MEKVLVEVYLTYGKRDGEELAESYVENLAPTGSAEGDE